MTRETRSVVIAIYMGIACTSVWAAGEGRGQAVQARIDQDVAVGLPIVVHITVALCDNVNQGIVPVPKAIGNGQDPKSNLYWGALYGIRTHLPRASDWKRVDIVAPVAPPILERIAFYASIKRNGASAPVYIVADAWDGARMRESLESFTRMSSGHPEEVVEISRGGDVVKLRAGGRAHLVAFVGHNGLMDFSLAPPTPSAQKLPARSALVLSCASKSYFTERLNAAGAHPLLLTTGLMAPEAYTIDAAIRSWAAKGSTDDVGQAAAKAYHKYQKCGMKGARRLFWGAP